MSPKVGKVGKTGRDRTHYKLDNCIALKGQKIPFLIFLPSFCPYGTGVHGAILLIPAVGVLTGGCVKIHPDNRLAN